MAQRHRDNLLEQPSFIKEEVQTAIIDAARITGWAALDRPSLVAAFRGRVGRSTMYRWIDALLDTPLDRATAEIIRDARQGSPAQVQSVAREIQERAAGMFPVLPTIEETAAVVIPVPVVEKLNMCLAAAQDVMSRSRDTAGAVRNSKMLLAASEHLRRSLETVVKLQEAISDGLQIEQFHATIMEEIAKIDPMVAGRIATRLLEVNAVWAGRPDIGRARS